MKKTTKIIIGVAFSLTVIGGVILIARKVKAKKKASVSIGKNLSRASMKVINKRSPRFGMSPITSIVQNNDTTTVKTSKAIPLQTSEGEQVTIILLKDKKRTKSSHEIVSINENEVEITPSMSEDYDKAWIVFLK